MYDPLIGSSPIGSILIHVGLLVAGLIILAYFLTRKDARAVKYLKEFTMAPTAPIFGTAFYLLGPKENILPVVVKWVKAYGPCLVGWLGNLPYIFLADPNGFEKILSSTVHINKAKDYEYLEAWLGTGLLTAQRQKWFHRRKLLTPTFHFKILEDFIPVFNEHSKILNVVLEKQRQKSDVFDICPFITRCTLDVISETAMGDKINAQLGGEPEYVKAVCGMTKILLQKALNPLYRISFIWKLTPMGKLETKYLKYLHDFTDKMIKDRKTERKRKLTINSARLIDGETAASEDDDGSKKRKAFLDLLLDVQENEDLTDGDVREEVDTFMFEGHDTTAANLDWFIMMMACNPKCQKLVHEELDRVFANDLDRDVTMADMKELKYLECCLKETLRLYPSVPFFMRHADVDIQIDEKRTIPKGTNILLSTYILHRYEKIFPDPEKFDPTRFSPENAIGRHPYAYVPFSAGPRNCIGQKFALIEEKIILSTLLRKFKFEPVDTPENVPAVPAPILRPKHGIKVKLVRRC